MIWRELLVTLAGVVAGVLLLWLVLVGFLLLRRPDGTTVTGLTRLLPDLIRLVTRLARDRTMPRGVRVRLWSLLAYLACPIDLIPDFIPVLGYLDELILLPIGIWLVLRLVPRDVLAECRKQAEHWQENDEARPRGYLAAGVIIAFWLAVPVLAWLWLGPRSAP